MKMNGDELMHTKPLPGSKICEKVKNTGQLLGQQCDYADQACKNLSV